MIATLRDWTIQPVFGAIALFSVVYGGHLISKHNSFVMLLVSFSGQLGYSSYQNAMGRYESGSSCTTSQV